MDKLLLMVSLIEEPNKSACLKFIGQNEILLKKAKGSSHNHQTWEGGYIDHVVDCGILANHFYRDIEKYKVPFTLSDALLVLFLHDIEKPFKTEHNKEKFKDKKWRQQYRSSIIKNFEFSLTDQQINALTYVEGEGNDYSSEKRAMNELAAFCHICDVFSARIFHSISLHDYDKYYSDYIIDTKHFPKILW